jgi:peroxisomal membrane protein 2
VLCFLQEVLATHLAGVPTRKPLWIDPWYKHLLARAKVDNKALKMAAYGFLVSAPLGHYLVGWLQKAFSGRTGPLAKVAQIVASNVLIAPVQASGASCFLTCRAMLTRSARSVYLSSMAVINGAKSFDEVMKTVKGGFMTVLKVRSRARARRAPSDAARVGYMGQLSARHGVRAGIRAPRGTRTTMH